MIERWIGYCAIVTPNGDSQSSGLNDLNRVIEADHVICGTSLNTGICRSGTFVLVSEAHYFAVAKPELPYWTREHHQPVWPLDSMTLSRAKEANQRYDAKFDMSKHGGQFSRIENDRPGPESQRLP